MNDDFQEVLKRISRNHGVVVGIGVVIWVHPNPSYTKSLTTTPSTLATTWAGKVTPGGSGHVIRDGFVGLMEQLLSWLAI
jgi:hypothetical protein